MDNIVNSFEGYLRLLEVGAVLACLAAAFGVANLVLLVWLLTRVDGMRRQPQTPRWGDQYNGYPMARPDRYV